MSKIAITIFGGSWPATDSVPYGNALRLGQLIAQQGWTVVTGGYIGTMEAASRGAAEHGGHVIGVTSEEIEQWRNVGPNRWVHEERRYPTVRERLFALIDICDAAVALPGGIGTLNEIAFMWSQVQTESIRPRPLILIGPEWKSTLDLFLEQLGPYVPEAHRHLLTYSPDVETAFERLRSVLNGDISHAADEPDLPDAA